MTARATGLSLGPTTTPVKVLEPLCCGTAKTVRGEIKAVATSVVKTRTIMPDRCMVIAPAALNTRPTCIFKLRAKPVARERRFRKLCCRATCHEGQARPDPRTVYLQSTSIGKLFRG